MIIERIEIVRLYGAFTKNVDFHAGLNLLVGINGSGKTSILNCIEWMTAPNIARLACTHFHSIKLFIRNAGKHYIIHARRTTSILTVTVTGGGMNAEALKLELERPVSSIKSEQDLFDAMQYYDKLTPEAHERQVWAFLNELPKPLSVSLDRTITADTDGEVFYEGVVSRQKVRRPRSPISKVVDVTRARFVSYKKKIQSHNDTLKSKLMVSAFKSPFAGMSEKPVSMVTTAQLSELEGKVTSLLYSSVEMGAAEAESIRSYFEEAREIITYGESDETAKTIFYAQYRHIHELAEAFREYEASAARAYESIGSYLEALNSFFKESKKQIGFNDSDGVLGFRHIGQDNEAVGSYYSIDRMSSGERQLIILITFLAFVSKKDHVFIVDEPELSLHPRWQRNFVSTVIQQSPKGSQIIMATHSPEIVSRYRDNCVILDV